MARPRIAPRQQRSRETYDRILDVAAKIFSEQGYAGTTTNKVAEVAGISIGTLYHYVPDKDALLYALAERHLDTGTAAILGTFRRLRKNEPGLAESLRTIIEVVVYMHVEQSNLHHLLYNGAPQSPELGKRLHEADAAIAAEVAWHLERVDVANEHRALTAQLMVSGIEAQAHSAIIDAKLHGETPADPGVLIEVLTRLWTRALQDS